MKNTFACPHCEGVLNPHVKILLVAETKRCRGLILLSPQPGNYKYLCDRSLEEVLQPGEKIYIEIKEVKDPDITVGKLLDQSGASVKKFYRLEVGEGIEKKMLEDALKKARYNKTRAAESLGISFRSFRYKLKKFGID